MANSSAAQPTQRAKVYQFPDLRTASAPGDLSMLLERLTTVERQQEEMRLRQTSTALTTVLTNLVHNAFLFELNEAISDGVPLSRLLSVVAVVLSAFSIASLATWLIGNIPLIHPVMSLMSLVAAPFIYLMGRATQSARR